jgi:hypothetical protein
MSGYVATRSLTEIRGMTCSGRTSPFPPQSLPGFKRLLKGKSPPQIGHSLPHSGAQWDGMDAEKIPHRPDAPDDPSLPHGLKER